MKARYGYLLAFLLPALMFAAVAGVLAVAAGAGVLWLGVYGDDSWPDGARTLLAVFAVAVAVGIFALLAAASYQFGKRRETAGGVSRRHVIAALAVAILIPALVLIRQCTHAGHAPAPSSPAGVAHVAGWQGQRGRDCVSRRSGTQRPHDRRHCAHARERRPAQPPATAAGPLAAAD